MCFAAAGLEALRTSLSAGFAAFPCSSVGLEIGVERLVVRTEVAGLFTVAGNVEGAMDLVVDVCLAARTEDLEGGAMGLGEERLGLAEEMPCDWLLEPCDWLLEPCGWLLELIAGVAREAFEETRPTALVIFSFAVVVLIFSVTLDLDEDVSFEEGTRVLLNCCFLSKC
jgi:hypothetical protein